MRSDERKGCIWLAIGFVLLVVLPLVLTALI